MAVRTRSLYIGRITSSGSSLVTTLYTVPTDRVAIVKELSLSQTSGSLSSLLYLYVARSGVSTQVAYIGLTANDFPEVRERWLVLKEGDALQLAQSASRTIDVTVSGTLLMGDSA